MDLDRAEVSGLMRSLLRSLEMTPDKEKALHERLYSRLSRISAEMTTGGGTDKRCPCEFHETQACDDNCSCRNKVMSGGCRRCATYGSYEQQLAAAKHLAETLDRAFVREEFE